MSIDADQYVSNTDQLRKILSEEIVLLREGRADPKRTNAVCNLCSKIIASVKLDMEVLRFKHGRIQSYSFEAKQVESDKSAAEAAQLAQ